VSSRDEVKVFEYRRQVLTAHASFLQCVNVAAPQADEARMELAACKSELACLTSAWEKKRQEMSSQLNKYKSRCSALERKRSSDISGLAHDVNCLQRSVRQALTQLARVKSARETYPLPTPPRPLSNALVSNKLSAASAHANGSSTSVAGKKKTGVSAASVKGAVSRARPMSASVDVHEREDEEWKHEVSLLHQLTLFDTHLAAASRVSSVILWQVAQQLSAVMQALQMVHSSVHALQVCLLLHSFRSRLFSP
jgi:uncharacterized protein